MVFIFICINNYYIRENDYIWSLNGPNQEILIATLIKTKFLDVKIINLSPGKKSHDIQFNNNTSYLSLNDNIKVSLSSENKEYNLNYKDGLYFPAFTTFNLKNLNNFNVQIIVCIGL